MVPHIAAVAGRGELLRYHLEDGVGGRVEAVGVDVIVQDKDRVHLLDRAELVVQVCGDLAQRLASL